MISEEQFINDLKEMLSSKEEIEMDTDLLDINGWDSLSIAEFIDMVQNKYNKNLELFTVAEAVLVEDLYRAVLEG